MSHPLKNQALHDLASMPPISLPYVRNSHFGDPTLICTGALARRTDPSPPKKLFQQFLVASFLVLFMFSAYETQAQFPGGFGQPGGFGGGNTSRQRSTRQYPNNAVGDAVFSIDPETRNLIVIADEDTSKYISEVVSNLDRPKPQVLIKVVFLEVTRNDSLDFGIEGSYNHNIGNPLTSGFMTNYQVLGGGTTNAGIFPSSITPITKSLALSNMFG